MAKGNYYIWRVKRDMTQQCTAWLAPHVAPDPDAAVRYVCTQFWVLDDVLRRDVLYVYARQGKAASALHSPVEYLAPP